jgi:DNA-binding CsgD family transcriptional regulator
VGGTNKIEPALDGNAAEGPLLAFLRVLANVDDGDTIADALVAGLLREFVPRRLSAYFVDSSGQWLDEAVHHGSNPDPGAYARVPVGIRMPLTEAFRTGEASAWTMDAAAAEFPALAGWLKAHPEARHEEVLCVPIRAKGAVVGTLLVSMTAPIERTWRLRLLLDAAATALAVWWGHRSDRYPRRSPAGSRGTTATARQRAIVEGIAAGRTNAHIARELGVSVGTVKSDLAALYRALGVTRREDLSASIGMLG